MIHKTAWISNDINREIERETERERERGGAGERMYAPGYPVFEVRGPGLMLGTAGS